MVNLLLAIILTSWLLISFRFFAKWGVSNLPVIILNYWVCVVFGLFYPGNWSSISSIQNFQPWIAMAFLTGACFLPTFYLMSFTVKKVSVTVATLANKTSLIIPVLVSLIFLYPDKKVAPTLWLGLIVGFASIVMTSWQHNNRTYITTEPQAKWGYWLPVLVFIGGALVDIMINISSALYLPVSMSGVFPVLAFGSSAAIGLVLIFMDSSINISLKNKKLWLSGVLLGVPNFLSIVFLMRALHDFNHNGAVVFPVLNISVILINSLVGIFVFKEQASRNIIIGLVLAVGSLLLVLQNG